jgi:hypothetical protein
MRMAGFITRYLAQIWKHHFRSFGSKRPDPRCRIDGSGLAITRSSERVMTNWPTPVPAARFVPANVTVNVASPH